MIFKRLHLLISVFSLVALFSSCETADPPLSADLDVSTSSSSGTSPSSFPDEIYPAETECVHEFCDWSVTKSASCTEDGTLVRSCSKCEYVETSFVSKISHTPVSLKAVSATCSATGLTEGSKCSVCNEVLVPQEIINKIDHSPTPIKSIPSTCTSTGLTEGSKCSSCGTVLVAQQPVAKTSHIPVSIKATASTCVSTGLTEGSKCSVCNTIITAQKTVSKTSHTPITVKSVPATCVSSGLSEGSKCSYCNTTITPQKSVPALGHNLKDGKCSRCDYFEKKEMSLKEFYDSIVYPVFDLYGNGYSSKLLESEKQIWITYIPSEDVVLSLFDNESTYKSVWEMYKETGIEFSGKIYSDCKSFNIIGVKVSYFVANPFDEDSYLLKCDNGIITYDGYEKFISSSNNKDASNENHLYGVGDTWVVPDQWEFTVDSVTTHYGCNQFADENDMPMFVTITFSYKNLGYVGKFQNLFISSVDFDVYDETGEAAETYPCTHDKSPKVLNVGAKCTGAQETYALYNKSDYITLVFEQYTSNNTGKKSVTYKLKIN